MVSDIIQDGQRLFYTTDEGEGEVELIPLGKGWISGKAQINHYVADGKNFGSPDKRVRISMSNFDSAEEAAKRFAKLHNEYSTRAQQAVKKSTNDKK